MRSQCTPTTDHLEATLHTLANDRVDRAGHLRDIAWVVLDRAQRGGDPDLTSQAARIHSQAVSDYLAALAARDTLEAAVSRLHNLA